MGQIARAIQDLPRSRFSQSQDCASKCRFTAPGFTNKAERLASIDIKRDSVHRFDYSFHITAANQLIERATTPEIEVHLKISNRNQWLAINSRLRSAHEALPPPDSA